MRCLSRSFSGTGVNGLAACSASSVISRRSWATWVSVRAMLAQAGSQRSMAGGSARLFRRVFSGWLYKESPSLKVVENADYDVTPKSCEMTYPAGPPAPAAPVTSSNLSSARKSGGVDGAAGNSAEPAPPAAPATPPSAIANNAT